MVYTELKETTNLMLSKDYKERFKAEFHQLNIRITKLEIVIRKVKNNEKISFMPNCPIGLLEEQLRAMKVYQSILYSRAEEENIKL